MSSNNSIKPSEHELTEFFDYISKDMTGRIGSSYVDFNNTLSYLLTITPEEFHNYYLKSKNILINDDVDKKNVNTCWLSNNDAESLRCIREIYNFTEQKSTNYEGRVLSEEECPKTFKFARNLWLYIWH